MRILLRKITVAAANTLHAIVIPLEGRFPHCGQERQDDFSTAIFFFFIPLKNISPYLELTCLEKDLSRLFCDHRNANDDCEIDQAEPRSDRRVKTASTIYVLRSDS
jgi:hypothetical protein